MVFLTKDNIGFTLIIVSVVLTLTSFIITAVNAASKDEFATLRADLTTIIVINSVAIAVLLAGIYLFYARFAQFAHIYNLVLVGIAMFMSFTALSVSVITKG